MNGRDGLIEKILRRGLWPGSRLAVRLEQAKEMLNRDSHHSNRLPGWD
jgi:hypothetical protein